MKLRYKRIISVILAFVALGISSLFVAQGADLKKMSEDLQNTVKQMSEEEKTDVYLEIEPGIKYDGTYNVALERRVLKEMGLTSVPSWRDDPEGHRQFEALRYSMLMEDYNKNAVVLLELLDVPEEDNLTPTGVTMYWHWRLTVSQINLASEQDCVIKMQATEFNLDDDEEPDLEAEIQYKDKFEEWSVNKLGEECLEEGCQYIELYTHYDGESTDWVLVEACYYSLPEPAEPTWLHIGGIGGRTVFGPSIGNCFLTGYGIYDVNDNEFYGFEQFADNDCTIFTTEFDKLPFGASKYDGLIDALEDLNIGCMTGDSNGDGTVDILDAIFIQKVAVDKEDIDFDYRFILDVNNDYNVDILDSTTIQKTLVDN